MLCRKGSVIVLVRIPVVNCPAACFVKSIHYRAVFIKHVRRVCIKRIYIVDSKVRNCMGAVHTHVIAQIILNEGYAGISITCKRVCCSVWECLLTAFRKYKLNIEILKLLNINFTCRSKLKTGEGVICKGRNNFCRNRFIYLNLCALNCIACSIN